MDELAAAFNPGVTSQGPGSSATMADEAMDVDKGKDDMTKKDRGTGGGMGSAVAGAHQPT